MYKLTSSLILSLFSLTAFAMQVQPKEFNSMCAMVQSAPSTPSPELQNNMTQLKKICITGAVNSDTKVQCYADCFVLYQNNKTMFYACIASCI